MASSFLEDKAYILHRQRLQQSSSRVSNHLPSGKGSLREEGAISGLRRRAALKEKRIGLENEALHARLLRLQLGKSPLHSEQLRFEEKFNDDKSTLLHNRLLSRIHKEGELKQDNLKIYRRIQSVHPQYSASNCQKWYSAQLKIRFGNRIIRDSLCPKELRPLPLSRHGSSTNSSSSSSHQGQNKHHRSLPSLHQSGEGLPQLKPFDNFPSTSSIYSKQHQDPFTSDASQESVAYISYMPPQLLSIAPSCSGNMASITTKEKRGRRRSISLRTIENNIRGDGCKTKEHSADDLFGAAVSKEEMGQKEGCYALNSLPLACLDRTVTNAGRKFVI